jgi:hypothetical protein
MNPAMKHKSQLPPDPDRLNQARARWAAEPITKARLGAEPDSIEAVGGLLANIAHWCDRNGVNMQAAIQRAGLHYQCETSHRGKQLTFNEEPSCEPS